ncbi:peptidoglycan D,D-transpeptidase FtsI family protein [Chlamydiota bacterium]
MMKQQRLVIVALGMFFLFSLLIAQYFKIQIVECEKWTKEALAQHECIVKEPFKRGSFYSNTTVKKGHPESPQAFVVDVTKFHLYIDPVSIPPQYRDEISTQLVKLTAVSPQMRLEFDLKSRSRRLAPWLDRGTKEEVMHWWVPYARKRKIPCNAIFFVTDYKRSYPFGTMLGQVLHTIREMKDEKTAQGLPTGGLEAYFNAYLKGKQGKRKLLRSPLNQLEIDKVIESPEDGADVYLTINHCIQAIAEEELEKGVLTSQAKGGWAVMMDPATGEILALAQYPFFDPSNYRAFFNDPEKIENSKVKAVTDAFEIGSIMKPITIAIGLKANEDLKKVAKGVIFHPTDKIDGTRTIFPGRGNKPLKDIPGQHRALNMYMAVWKSSNVYMAQIVDRVINSLGNEWYRQQLVETYGFGEKSGIELPAEAVGIVPTPGKKHANGALEWSTPTPYSLSIGYNLLATSMQMLRAYGVFANGGYLVQPTLVRKIVAGETVVYDSAKSRERPKRVLDPLIVRDVVRGMKFTTKTGGTGSLADVTGYTEAGKTGTAEKLIGGAYSKKKHISSFIGFAPASLEEGACARLVLIVSIDEPAAILTEGGAKNHMGGRCAAPIFKEIAKRTLEYLGVTPDDPYGYPPGDPRYDPEKADWVKEVKDLKILYDQWNK